MYNIGDLKTSINSFLSYTSNMNYLKNFIGSIDNANVSTVGDLSFELQVNGMIIEDFINLTMSVYVISSKELPIFFAEPNKYMVTFLNNSGSYLAGLSNLANNLVIINAFVRTFSQLSGGKVMSVDLTSLHSDNVKNIIKDLEPIIRSLEHYNRMI